jgi:hypothetical protein
MTCTSHSHHGEYSERGGQNKGKEEQTAKEERLTRETRGEERHEKWGWRKMKVTPSIV